MQHLEFITFLSDRLQQPLPGWKAQKKMSPIELRPTEPSTDNRASCRNSAVLVMLLPGELPESTLEVLFTLRSPQLNHHGGQISFPGGRSEKGESLLNTALREAQEEVNLHQESLKIMGPLSTLYVPVSNNIIHPFIAYKAEPQVFTPNPAEVAEIFRVPLDILVGEGNVEKRVWDKGKYSFEYPSWNIHHTVPLWGATAMIMSELVALYREFLTE